MAIKRSQGTHAAAAMGTGDLNDLLEEIDEIREPGIEVAILFFTHTYIGDKKSVYTVMYEVSLVEQD